MIYKFKESPFGDSFLCINDVGMEKDKIINYDYPINYFKKKV